VFKQLIGPVETLLHVRTSSQQVRDSIELDMVVKYLAAQNPAIDVQPLHFLFGSKSGAPLSWHLTKDQKAEIGGSWSDPENRTQWCKVRAKLSCGCDPEILRAAQENKWPIQI
jgi:hypothetical protein